MEAASTVEAAVEVEASVEAAAAAEAAAPEAGPTCVVPDGGAPCNPELITCGSQTCNNGSQFCCIESDGGACITVGASGCAAGLIWQCDEAADCQGNNQACCTQGAGGNSCVPESTLCTQADQCTGTSKQLCHSDSECGTTVDVPQAKRCIPQTCGLGARVGATCTGAALVLEACAYESTNWGALPGCTAN